ncbi:MAG: redox-sensing transcriptional repressor Rex [Chloroflexi bacterium]|nr:redox-sensing transcriptional repressor Rex [Chloroflexota bacterium]
MDVPDVVVERLPLYVRVLTNLASDGTDMVSSEQLGDQLHMTPAQIRKDLSYFGRFGKQGRGYNVVALVAQLKGILGLDRSWNACIVGMGRLGRAIISYPGFAPEGFKIVAAFDADDGLVGTNVDGTRVRSLSQINHTVSEDGISIGIVAVPASAAQAVIDALVDAGIGAILNYAPVTAHVPDHVKIKNIDPVMSLQSMTYYLKR